MNPKYRNAICWLVFCLNKRSRKKMCLLNYNLWVWLIVKVTGNLRKKFEIFSHDECELMSSFSFCLLYNDESGQMWGLPCECLVWGSVPINCLNRRQLCAHLFLVFNLSPLIISFLHECCVFVVYLSIAVGTF